MSRRPLQLGRRTLAAIAVLALPQRTHAQGPRPAEEFRSDVIGLLALGGNLAVQVHDIHHVDARRDAWNELKPGVGLEFSPRSWRLSAGYEHVTVRDSLSRSTEERGVIEAGGRARLTSWLSASDRQRAEIRDVGGTWSDRWSNRLRGDFGADARIFANPWVAHEWWYDSRYRSINRRGWLYGMRLHTPSRFVVDGYFLNEVDSRRGNPRLRAVGLTLRMTSVAHRAPRDEP